MLTFNVEERRREKMSYRGVRGSSERENIGHLSYFVKIDERYGTLFSRLYFCYISALNATMALIAGVVYLVVQPK